MLEQARACAIWQNTDMEIACVHGKTAHAALFPAPWVHPAVWKKSGKGFKGAYLNSYIRKKGPEHRCLSLTQTHLSALSTHTTTTTHAIAGLVGSSVFTPAWILSATIQQRFCKTLLAGGWNSQLTLWMNTDRKILDHPRLSTGRQQTEQTHAGKTVSDGAQPLNKA